MLTMATATVTFWRFLTTEVADQTNYWWVVLC